MISLAERLGGVKAYYFVQKLEQIREMVADGKDVISFGIGSPDLAPSEETINTFIKLQKAQTIMVTNLIKEFLS